MENTLNLTLVSGKQVTLKAQYNRYMCDKILDADGYKIDAGKEIKIDAEMGMYVDGQLTGNTRDANFWQVIDVTEKKYTDHGCTKKIWGLPFVMTEENAKKYEEWIEKVKDNGTTEDAKMFLTEKEEKKRIAHIERLKNIIKESEEYIKHNGKLLTNDERKKWRINYNNIMNEGGEGFLPDFPSLEEYEGAKNELEKLNGGAKNGKI